ncbi:MAG: biotin/lipoyl-containing protein, partial [Spirosomataceae bacterium]
MAQIEIKVPPVGESITEVTIGNWLKKEGDYVKVDEVICGLDSDKATFELVAESEGVLHIKAKEGDTIPIGGVIATIETSAEAAAKPAPAAPAASAAPKEEPAPQVEVETPKPSPTPSSGNVLEMKVPAVGESISEVTIANWL